MAHIFVSFAIDGNAEAYAYAHHVLASNGFHRSMHRDGRHVAFPSNCVGRSVPGSGVARQEHVNVSDLLLQSGVRLTHLVVVEIAEIALQDRSGRIAFPAAPAGSGAEVAGAATGVAGDGAGEILHLAAAPADDGPFPWG